MSGILVGTSSWTDRSLVEQGHFYPPGVRTPAERLRYYASVFPLVEVDSTYYAPPSERNAVLWMERTPPTFTFNVKAFSLLTNHPTPPRALHRDLREALPSDLRSARTLYRHQIPKEILETVWQRFREALMPLHSAGKLGAVIFQFPPWFTNGRASRDYLLECAARLPDYRIAVEFRHGSWMRGDAAERTLAFLGEHELPYVCVDMPQGFASSLPPIAAVTAPDLALVRFHGRNRTTWEARGISASERFRYKYTRKELLEWVPRVRSLATTARETHVLFNNCYRDHAVVNAQEFLTLLNL